LHQSLEEAIVVVVVAAAEHSLVLAAPVHSDSQDTVQLQMPLLSGTVSNLLLRLLYFPSQRVGRAFWFPEPLRLD
jgi:hypothetical protein